jgi:tRNA-specific 2-thiouridylase
VVVALSGGVDSAVAAALLVEKGHRVVGMTLRLYDANGTAAASGGRCCGPRDIEDARRVCEQLDIPYYVIDYEAVFREAVIDDFVGEYLAGRTPNPCVRCNEKVKFAPLLARARALGASALATGHYARIVSPGAGHPQLYRAVDGAKDQSYFLFGLPRAALTHTLFPLGELTKEQVRQKARELGLPNAEKAESQEICFVPDGDYAGFVERAAAASRPDAGGPHRPPAPGAVVDAEGNVLGPHRGLHHFTLGQRRGLGPLLAASHHTAPRYVVGLNVLKNEVVVGDERALERRRVRVGQVRWLDAAFRERLGRRPPTDGTDEPVEDLEVAVQLRHRHRPGPARLLPTAHADELDVEFVVPERAPAPGQAAVFYLGEQVLGGGFIQ